MVRAGDLRGATLFVAVLTALHWPALGANDAAFPDMQAADFAARFAEEASRQGLQTRLVEQSCYDEDPTACENDDPRTRAYDFGTSSAVVENVRGGAELAELRWHCGRDCQASDLEIGLLVSLAVLAPNVRKSEIDAWKARIGAVVTRGGGVSNRLGAVRLDVFSNPRNAQVDATFTKAAAPATNKNSSTTLIVLKMREAEKLIARAIEISDFEELNQQSRSLYKLIPQMNEDRDFDLRAQCGIALGQLTNVVSDVTNPELTRTRAERAFAADRSLYIETMMRCERELRLDPPGSPNLR